MQTLSRLSAALITLGMATLTATAAPPEGTVVSGDVTFAQAGSLTVIQASDGSIINYPSFDILSHETVQFVQPHELARVLNRIGGPEPTLIHGTLLSNGQVYLVNPAGVLFGAGAVVDVGGLVAAAGTLSDTDFLARVDSFSGLAGAVVNDGSIRGGTVHLIGRHVANHGTIVADGGVLTMVAGNEVHIRRHGERVTVQIDGRDLGQSGPTAGGSAPDLAGEAGVTNTGALNVDGGQVILGAGDLYSLAVHNTGRIESGAGEIMMAAHDGLVHNAGLIDASTVTGPAGAVAVQGPSVLNTGTIAADAEAGAAGSVRVVGHDHTYLTADSRISAAGTAIADGGDVTVNTVEGLTAMAAGAIVDVSGGAAGGDGGTAEISGRHLLFNGFVDAGAAPGGRPGMILFDPATISINDTGSDDGFLADSNTISFDTPDAFTDLFISDEAIEALVGDILLQATLDLHVNHPLHLVHGNNLTLEAGRRMNINAPIEGVNDLGLFADADHDGVGDLLINTPLTDVHGSAVFQGATVFLNGGVLRTDGTQTYLSPVDLCRDTTLESSGMTFMDTLDATADDVQALWIVGPVEFQDEVGGRRNLRGIFVDGPAAIDGGLVDVFDIQHYLGDVTLGADTVLRTEQPWDVIFEGSVNGAYALDIQNPGVTRFCGPVGDLAPLTVLHTDAAGSTEIGGDMTAARLDFDDPVRLKSDARLLGTDLIDFDSTVDGHAALTTSSGRIVRFGGDVGGLEPLAALTTNVDGLLLFDGAALVKTTGDILLNPLGRGEVPVIATVAGLTDALRLHSAMGDVRLGPNQKLTVVGDQTGDLTIEAPLGTITIGDINTLGDMTIIAPLIEIRTRPPGLVRTPSGDLRLDRGVDFFAGGRILFSTTPVLIGDGAPPTFVSRDVLEAVLAAFPRLEFGQRRGDFFLGPIILDLGLFFGGDRLAEALPELPAPIEDRVDREPFALRPMERLAIFLRGLDDEELRADTEGRRLVNDLAPPGTAEGPSRIAADRLLRSAVVEAVERFAAMFTPEVATTTSAPDQTAYIRRTLDAAWRAYDRQAGVSSFRAFLQDDPAQGEALAYVNGLRDLFRALVISGATTTELRRTADAVLEPITPEGMHPGDLEMVITEGLRPAWTASRRVPESAGRVAAAR